MLKPGGTFVIEDLISHHPFTDEESDQLKHIVSAPTVTPISAYKADLEAADFEILEVKDMSEPWTDWVVHRYEAFKANETENIDFFGPAIYDLRCQFYLTIQNLF